MIRITTRTLPTCKADYSQRQSGKMESKCLLEMINNMIEKDFKEAIMQGIPSELPAKAYFDNNVSHAPKRKAILSHEEEKLAIRNALRYFPKEWHNELAAEFLEELR